MPSKKHKKRSQLQPIFITEYPSLHRKLEELNKKVDYTRRLFHHYERDMEKGAFVGENLPAEDIRLIAIHKWG